MNLFFYFINAKILFILYLNFIQKGNKPLSGLYENKDTLLRLIKMLAIQYGSKSEIILHDLTSTYESTIIGIENNHLTGRKVGDCGSNLGLEILRQDSRQKNHDSFGYITHLKDGRIFRSSTLYIYNEEGSVEGCLCINTDITEMKELSVFFSELYKSQSSHDNEKEVFAKNVGELVDYYIEKHQELLGKDSSEMSKSEKLDAIRYFDEKGVFLISKSGNKICRYLGISKGTLYSYLENVRDPESK